MIIDINIKELGYEYSEILACNGAVLTKIPKGKSKELYFLFTTPDPILHFS